VDKSWIKWVLILAFVISLVGVAWSSIRALEDGPAIKVASPPPPPTLTMKPVMPANPTAAEIDVYLKQEQQATALDREIVQTYGMQVDAYGRDLAARITAGKAETRDSSARLTAFEKVIKDTLGPLVIAPLLAALLIYSGLKVGADVAMARVTSGATKDVRMP
jgi:hypothetical protein